MDLANMRSLGVRSIYATCDCGRAAAVDASTLAGSVEVPSLRFRLGCSLCGARPNDVRPDWRENGAVFLAILAEQRNYSEALKFYGNDSAIVERLVASEPEKAEWRYDLGIVNERIGDVRYAQGDLVEAAKSYAAKQKLISRLAGEEDLARSDPQNAEWSHDVSVSYAKLASVYQRTAQIPTSEGRPGNGPQHHPGAGD